MPVFNYKGYDKEGRTIAGSIESSGLNEAILRIKEKGIFPAEVSSSEEPAPSLYQRLINRTPPFLADMTRQLSILTIAGVPLTEALRSLSREEKGYYKSLLMSIREKVLSGASLNRALSEFNIFPEFYIQMVKAGEESGTLDRVLKRLAEFLNKKEEMRARMISAMIYPLIMVGVSVIVLSFLFTFVIPKIVKIFNDTKAVLPVLTRILIFVSNIFISYWWVLVILFIAISIALRGLIKRNRQFFDRTLLLLPYNPFKSLYFGRFARIMSFLIEGGLPLLKALDISSGVTGNSHMAYLIRLARERVAEGQGLSSSLEGFPPVFLQLIATGERSGSLGEVLRRAADSYEESFSRSLDRMVSILEPALILTMGLIVGLIVAAVLLPMLQLNQLIKI